MNNRSNIKKLIAGAVSVLALGLSGTAMAATAGGNLSVSATVTANCTVSTSPVAFGSVNTLSGAAVEATGDLTVTCTNGTAWEATADVGMGAGANLVYRKMASGANLLTYQLFTDSVRVEGWGEYSFAGTGTGAAQANTIYGSIRTGQTSAPAGSYADTVAVTITY